MRTQLHDKKLHKKPFLIAYLWIVLSNIEYTILLVGVVFYVFAYFANVVGVSSGFPICGPMHVSYIFFFFFDTSIVTIGERGI